MRGWNKLQEWINEEQENLLLQQRLTPAANDWHINNRPNGLLLPDGDRLNQLEKIKALSDNWFNQRESEFVQASINYRNIQQRLSREQQTRTELLQKVDKVEDSVISQPLSALTLAIQIIGNNLKQIPHTILTTVQSSLHKTISLSRELNFIDSGTYCVDFNPNREMIVSGDSGIVRLWDLKGNLISESLSHNGSSVSIVAFSPDGNYIASGGGSGFYLWSIDKINKSLHLVKSNPNFSIESIAFSPSGNCIISGSSDQQLQVWDNQGELVNHRFIAEKGWLKDNPGNVNVAFGSSEKYFYSACGDTIMLWQSSLIRASNSFQVLDQVNCLALSPDGEKIVIGSDQGNMGLYSQRDVQRIFIADSDKPDIEALETEEDSFEQTFTGYKSSYPIQSVKFSPNGEYIVSGSFDRTLRLWDLEGNLINTPFMGHDQFVYSVAFSPDGKRIASGGLDGIRIWDTHGYTADKVFEAHQGEVNVAIFNSDGNYIISGGDDGSLRLWDMKGNLLDQKNSTNDENAITCLSSSPDGKYIVSGNFYKSLKLWTIKDKLLHQIFVVDQDSGINAVAFSPTENLIASGGESGLITLWDLEGNPVDKPPIKHESRITSIAFSPDGKLLASGSSYHSFGLWNINDGQCLIQPTINDGFFVDCLVFSPDGQSIMIGINNDALTGRSFGGVLKLFDLQGNPLASPFTAHEDRVTSIKFSPDGKLIASSGDDGTVRLWDLQGNAIGSPFLGHKYGVIHNKQRSVTSLDFDSTRSQIVSSGVDGTLRLWSVDWLSWLQIGCDRLRDHPVFKNPQTEVEKQAWETCQNYVWEPEKGAQKLYEQARKRIEEENLQAAEERNFSAAISILSLVIQLNPDHAGAYYHRGKCYAESNNQQKTTEDFKEAATLYHQQGKTETEEYQEVMKFLNHFQS